MGFDIDKLGKAAEENKKKKAAGKFDISKVGAAAVQSKKTKSTKPVGKEVATAYYGRSAIEKLKKEPEKATVKDFNTAVKGARVLGKYGLLSDEDVGTVATGADTVFSNAAKSSPARVVKRDFDKKTEEQGGLLPDVFGMKEQTQASFPTAAKKTAAPEGSWWKDKPTTAFDIQSRYHNLGRQFSGLQEKFIAGEATDEDFDDYTRSMNTFVSEAPKVFDAEITRHEVKSYGGGYAPFTSTQEADEAKAAVGKAYESVYERFLKGQATEEDYTALAGSMADYEGRNKKAILDGIYVAEADDALRAANAAFYTAADSLENALTDAAYDPDDPAAAAALKVKEEAESRVQAAEKRKYDAEAIRGEYRDSAAYDELLGQYAYAFEAPDFAEKSKYKTTANGKKAKLNVSGTYDETGFNDYYYDYINKNPDAQSIKTTNDIARLGASAAFVKTDETEMNADEIALYNYLYATEGPEKAGDFVKDLTGVLNKRSRQTYQDWYADYAAKHPVRASVFSTLIAPAKGVIGTVGQISDYADDGKIDQNAPYNKLSHVQSSIRSAVTKEVEENWGAVGSFAYGTGMSMADFLFTALVGKGVGSAVSGGTEQAAKVASNISLGIMGSGAAADATIDAKDRGLDDNQAMLLGVIAGAAEIITEKVSLENLFSDEWEKSAWKYLTKNLVAEGSEEGASSLINLAADVLIAGDKSEIKQATYKYMDLGYSEQEAFGRAMADQAEAIGLDMLGGAVSGGLMGGGRIGLGAITQVRKTNTYYKELGGKLRTGGDGTIDALLELAGDNAENSDSFKLAEKLRKALVGGKEISDTELGKLEVLTLADIEKASVKAQSTKGEAVSDATEAVSAEAAPEAAEQEASVQEENAKDEKKKKNTNVKDLDEDNPFDTDDVEYIPIGSNAQDTVRTDTVGEAVAGNAEAGMNNDTSAVDNKPAGVDNDTVGTDNRTVTFDNKAANMEGMPQVSSTDGTAVIDEKAAAQETENPFGTEDEGIRSEDGRSENVFGEEEEADFDDANPFAYAEESEGERNDRRLEKDYGIPDEKERESRLFFEAGLSEGDIDEDTAASIKRLSKLVDKDIYFYREAEIDGTVSNGYYDSSDSSIHINLQAENPVAQIIGHELTHSLEGSKSYAALQKTVFDYINKTERPTAIDDERIRLADVYKRNGKPHSTEAEVDADILANFVGTKLLTDENAIRYVVGYKRSFGVWMREQITRLKAAFGSKNAKTQAFLDKAARLYHDALAESKNAVRSETNEKDSKYSVTQNYDFTKSFAEQVDDFKNGKIPAYDSLVVSGTPEIYQKAGFNALPITLNQTHADYALNGTKDADHFLGEQVLKQLPQAIADPVAIIGSQTQSGRAVAILKFDVNGKQVVVPMEIDGHARLNSIRIDSNAIVSVYGKNTALQQLRSAILDELNGKTSLFYWNKKEAVALAQRAGLQLPSGLPKDGSIHSIRESGSKVNTKLENVTHSQQFKRWFGDWVNKPYSASKVVDEDGKPLVVYHGTDADFTVFKSKDGNYWFSASEDYAEAMAEERGGNRVMSTYLNMRKPYYAKLKPSQFSDPNFEGAIIREAKSKGYDGVILENDTSNDWEKDTFYVVFAPTQIKSATDNIGTFDGSNADIRFSVSEAADDTAKAKPDKGKIVIVENALAKEEARRLNENAPGEYARAAEERRSIERAAVEEGIQEAQERENDPNLIVENALAKEESRRLNEKASAEYDRLLQEEYNKRQVLYSPDEGKSVKREDLKLVDKKYLERTERQLMNRLAQRMGVPYGMKDLYLKWPIRALTDEFLEKGNISQTSVDEAFNRAMEAGRRYEESYYQEYKYVKDYFRTVGIPVEESVKKDFRNWNRFRQSTMGTLRLVNKESGKAGLWSIDEAWEKLRELAPGLVKDNVTAASDKLRVLFEICHGIQKIEFRVSDAYSEEQKAWEKRDFENAVYDSIRDFRTVRTRAIEAAKPEEKFDAETLKNMSETEKNQIAASLIKTNNAAVEAKRNIDKVSRKFPLTGDEEMLVGDLLKGKITFAALDGDRYNLKNIKAVYEARANYEANAAVLSEYAKKHKAMLIAEADGVLRNMVDTHDKAGINYSTETAERNIRDTFGDNATSEKIIDTYFRPVHKNEAAKTRMMNEYIARVKELKLSNKLSAADKKAGRVSESAAVQILGEAQGNIEFLENQKKRGKALAERDGKTLGEWKGVIADLWKNNPQLDKMKIEAAVKEFRKIYDELIGEVNRARVLNGYPAISYRAGYFPHFSRSESIDGIMDKITAALGGSTEVTELPTEIAGRTGVFKPGIRWFGAALERLGINTDYDALYGFARYLDGAADIIYHTDDIGRLRALASQIRYKTSEKRIQEQIDELRKDDSTEEAIKLAKMKMLYDESRYSLSSFVNWLDEYTNILAGKKSETDRKIESAIGRKFYNLSKAIEGRVGANMVGGNLASALTNFIPITQAGGSVGSLDLLSGMWDTIKSYKADDGFADRSDFLTSRFGVDALTQTTMQKISSAAGVPMEFIDAFTSNTLVRARYNQNLRSGLSEEAALREADEWAAGLMAGRSKGEMPTIYHSRNLLLKPFTMFQLEVKNQYSYLFKDLPRDFKNRDKNLAKLIAAYFKIFLGAYIFNDLYEKLVGRRSALDPLGIINDTVGDVTGYKLPNVIDGIGDLVSGNGFDFEKVERPDNNADLIGGIAMDIGGEVPFIGGALGGGRIPLLGGGYDKTPVKSIVPDMEKITNAIFNEKWSTKKRVNTALSELGKSVGANVVAPVAGGQIRKIIQGVNAAVSGGSYTMDADGNKILQYPVISENGLELAGNIAKGALFGKSSFETAGDWVDSGFKSFSAKATALYDGLCDSGESEKAAFALISNLRNAEKTDEESRSAVQRDMIRHSALTGSGKAIAYAALGASDKEQELIASLDDAGADMGAVADALMDIKDIDGSKALKGAEKSNAKRSVLLQMGLTDEEKQSIYRVVFNESRESEIAEFGAAGMSFDTFLKIQNEYSEIGERDLKASEKATEFSYIIDGMKLNDKQREVAKDCFTYFSMVPAEASRYDKFVAAGLDKDLSYTLNGAMAALEPEEGKQSVSAIQKYRVIIDSDLTEDERETAFRVVMSEDEYAKFERGRSLGMPQEAYVLYKENTGDFDTNGNGRLSGSEIEDLIEYISGGGKAVLPGSKSVRFISMTTAQKAVLWQMMSGSKSVKNNPYNSKKGVQAAKEYLRLKEEGKEEG